MSGGIIACMLGLARGCAGVIADTVLLSAVVTLETEVDSMIARISLPQATLIAWHYAYSSFSLQAQCFFLQPNA